MKFSKDWSKEKGKVVSKESKDGVFSFLEQFINISEATHIVSVKINKHFLPIEFDCFKHFRIFLPSKVDPKKGTVKIISSLSQYSYNFIKLRWKDNGVNFIIIHLPFPSTF